MFSETKKRVYRHLKYALIRPRPPATPVAFDGPVLVVGSAPVSHKPAGFDDTFRVITVNGAQIVAERWGIEGPDITFMQFNQIGGTNTNAVEVRRVLNGKRTGMLFVLLWREGMDALQKGLKAFDYGYEGLRIVNRYERMALLGRVCGFKSVELDAESKCSNGINAVLFALYHGAPAVIMSGISPHASGHAYNRENLPRFHKDMDQKVLRTLLDKGFPVFTADPEVAERAGIPLWTGKDVMPPGA